MRLPAEPWSKNSPRLHIILQPRAAGVKFLEVVIVLAIKEFKLSLQRRVVKRY